MTIHTKTAFISAMFATALLAGCDLVHYSNVVLGEKSYEILAMEEFDVYDGDPLPTPDLYIDPGEGYYLVKCSPNSVPGCKKTLETALSHPPTKPVVNDTRDKDGGGDGGQG